MPSLKNLIENPELIEKLKIESRCSCGSSLPHPDDVQYLINRKRVCEDCYYESLGEGIELHPICAGRVRRG